jgi:hypothetical protein
VAAQTRADTFERADQLSGWGTASDGHNWGFAHSITTALLDNRGIAETTEDHEFLEATLGPALAAHDGDVLVRWSESTAANGFGVLWRSASGSFFMLAVGNDQLTLLTNFEGWHSAGSAGTVHLEDDADYWVRYHVEGDVHSARCWADGDEEPSDWDLVVTPDPDICPTSVGSVGIYCQVNEGVTFRVDHFSAMGYLDPPADDPDHWVFWAAGLPAQPGVPVLYGPFVIDYANSDLNANSEARTLWTPDPGDVLLRLVSDPTTDVSYDFGEITIKTGSTELANTNDGIDDAHVITPYVFSTDDPVRAVFTIGGGDSAGAGHVDVYALVARAVTP